MVVILPIVDDWFSAKIRGYKSHSKDVVGTEM
jgi:hypothetical protein